MLRGSARGNVLTSKAGQAVECFGKVQMFVRKRGRKVFDADGIETKRVARTTRALFMLVVR
jgi:hypothetical protein